MVAISVLPHDPRQHGRIRERARALVTIIVAVALTTMRPAWRFSFSAIQAWRPHPLRTLPVIGGFLAGPAG